MQCVVRVAPLRALPAHASLFDYVWTSEVAPQPGMVVSIPFRASQIFAMVSEVLVESQFATKELAPKHIYTLLSPEEARWLSETADALKTTVSTVTRYMLPHVGERTSKLLQRHLLTHPPQKPKLGYAWYENPTQHDHALLKAISEATGHVAVIAATHERAATIAGELRKQVRGKRVFHYESGSAPARRDTWLAWTQTEPVIVVGTHLTVWLPHMPDITWVLDDPTCETHTQWDGMTYSNRQIINSRLHAFGGSLSVVAHSPDQLDLDRATNLPELSRWPTIIDRTSAASPDRTKFLSNALEDVLRDSPRTLFLVNHLKESTHRVCKDCGALYPDELVVCATCGGNQFALLGYGGQMLKQEIMQREIVTDPEQIIMIDAQSYWNVKPHHTAVIATSPLIDRLDLSRFDVIVDLSTDFELLHPAFDTEERLWKRLRATAVLLSKAWAGSWYVQTRKPDLAAWGVRGKSGYDAWWKRERPLRERFNQPPFNRA